jgi:uncharacterized membrane protein YbhN (UPF0104 family)
VPTIRVPLAFKLIASTALLVLVLLRVDVTFLAQTLATANSGLILPATGMAVGGIYINTYKWRILLAVPGVQTNYTELLRLNFIGLFYNLLLPGQVGGEVVKSVKLRQMGVNAGAAALSVLLDRLTGLLGIVLLGSVSGLLFIRLGPGQATILFWMVGLAVILVAATLLLAAGHRLVPILARVRVLRLLINWLIARFPSMLHLPPGPDRPLSALALPLLLAIVFQITVVFTNLLICWSLGIPLSFVPLVWIVAVVSVLQALPISVAGIGVREGAYVYLLQAQGVDSSHALALSLIVFAIQVLLAAIGGLLQLLMLLRKHQPAQ